MRIIMDRRAVNFVDENNVLLGYSLEQSCCEDAGWFIADREDEWLRDTYEQKSMLLPGWVFDTHYTESVPVPRAGGMDTASGAVRFRIVKDGVQKFIVLYNVHNGYYTHGFKFEAGTGAVIKECTL